jgi:hypothetical protein
VPIELQQHRCGLNGVWIIVYYKYPHGAGSSGRGSSRRKRWQEGVTIERVRARCLARDSPAAQQ